MKKWLCALLCFGTACAQEEVRTPFATPADAEKCRYVIQERLREKNPSSVFQEVHGDAEKSPLVLVIYTSLACPICAQIETGIFPTLLQNDIVKQGKLAIIVRDYPADPLSLRAANAAWAVPEKASHMRRMLFERALDGEKTWTTDMETLKKAVLDNCSCDTEKEAVTTALESKDLLRRIFEQRVKDKRTLGIDEVPTGFLLIKKGADEKAWQLLRIAELPATKEELVPFIEKLQGFLESLSENENETTP